MKFTLDANHKASLEKLAHSGMTPVVIAQRARILLLKDSGKSATAIADEVGVSRHTAELWMGSLQRDAEYTAAFFVLCGKPVHTADGKTTVR